MTPSSARMVLGITLMSPWPKQSFQKCFERLKLWFLTLSLEKFWNSLGNALEMLWKSFGAITLNLLSRALRTTISLSSLAITLCEKSNLTISKKIAFFPLRPADDHKFLWAVVLLLPLLCPKLQLDIGVTFVDWGKSSYMSVCWVITPQYSHYTTCT